MGWWRTYELAVTHPGFRSANLGSGERDVAESPELTAQEPQGYDRYQRSFQRVRISVH